MRFLLDPSLYLLLGSNILLLLQVHTGSADLGTVIWTYWLQSFFLIFTWALQLHQMGYSKPGTALDLNISVEIGNKSPADFSGTVGFLIIALGFSLIHAVVLLFIALPPAFLSPFLLSIPFGASHFVSALYYGNPVPDKEGDAVIRAFGGRLIPMHISVILFAVTPWLGLYSLVILKTFLDILGHVQQHRST